MVRGAPTARRGVSYLALLFAIAATAGALAAAGSVWSSAQRRERERELLWIGEEFRLALRSYVGAGDGRPPQHLHDLLDDPRTPTRRRHLRRIYLDPMTRQADWALLRDARGGIVGVHSRSGAKPLKRGGFAPAFAHFADAASYADWRFAIAADAASQRLRRADGAVGPALAASATSATTMPLRGLTAPSRGAARGANGPDAGFDMPPGRGGASVPPGTPHSTAPTAASAPSLGASTAGDAAADPAGAVPEVSDAPDAPDAAVPRSDP